VVAVAVVAMPLELLVAQVVVADKMLVSLGSLLGAMALAVKVVLVDLQQLLAPVNPTVVVVVDLLL
jgi:hypothetical protein